MYKVGLASEPCQLAGAYGLSKKKRAWFAAEGEPRKRGGGQGWLSCDIITMKTKQSKTTPIALRSADGQPKLLMDSCAWPGWELGA